MRWPVSSEVLIQAGKSSQSFFPEKWNKPAARQFLHHCLKSVRNR